MARALEDVGTGHLVVVTGAGISMASGIPTFRGDDPEAVWRHEVLEKGTYDFFRRDPVASWSWSLKLFDKIHGTAPNPGHDAVAALGAWHRGRGGTFTLVTQNIDVLHEAAGSRDPLKVHGTYDRVRCGSPLGCPDGAPDGSIAVDEVDFRPFIEAPGQGTLPRCQLCGDLIRPHVLWFDEFYADHADYRWDRVQDAHHTLDALLFVGTSFAVGVTDLFLRAAAQRRPPAFSIDPAGVAPQPGVTALQARAETFLPRVCGHLRIAA
ncbi:MAG: Sir2 family NAD-dependent protein deacetylase [Acidobacteriota bacterium]